jgi:UDP-glucose:glycoprotein glucosyltransferase
LFYFLVTVKDHYDLVILIAEKFLTAAEIAIMKLGLSLRIYSPRVEMFSQMAENKKTSNIDCNNFIDVGGKFICSIEELQKLINNVSII